MAKSIERKNLSLALVNLKAERAEKLLAFRASVGALDRKIAEMVLAIQDAKIEEWSRL